MFQLWLIHSCWLRCNIVIVFASYMGKMLIEYAQAWYTWAEWLWCVKCEKCFWYTHPVSGRLASNQLETVEYLWHFVVSVSFRKLALTKKIGSANVPHSFHEFPCETCEVFYVFTGNGVLHYIKQDVSVQKSNTCLHKVFYTVTLFLTSLYLTWVHSYLSLYIWNAISICTSWSLWWRIHVADVF